jgi:hypothetical protein
MPDTEIGQKGKFFKALGKYPMKQNNSNRTFLTGVILFLICFQLPGTVRAEDFWSKFHPYITLSETYDDNLYLERANKTEDFITTIYPGLRFSHSSEGFGIDLDYRLGLNYYSSQTNNNYVSHTGTLNTFYRFDRRWTLRLREYLIQSEEPRERDFGFTGTGERYFIATTRDRGVYLRNVVEPSLEYQFGRENRFSLLYRNNYYQNESSTSQNSRENSVIPVLNYWFNIRNGMVLSYTYTSGDFEGTPDLTGHSISGRYIYRFNPSTSIYGEYLFSGRDYQSPGTDYTVHSPSLGVNHTFSATLSGRAQLGYFWQEAVGISTFSGLTYNLGITQRAQQTTYELALEGGYREDLFTAENLGFTKNYRAVGSAIHQLQRRFSVGFFGSVEMVEFSQAFPGRIDWIYGARGTASYQPLRWLTISLEGSHNRNLSNTNTNDYIDNRAILRLTATHY